MILSASPHPLEWGPTWGVSSVSSVLRMLTVARVLARIWHLTAMHVIERRVLAPASNASDPFLLSWTKDAANPIDFTSGQLTTAYDTPGP